MKKGKKGAIEAYQIVITIIAILGFVIALFFWYSFKDVADVSDDACKLSVLARATAPDKLQAYVPLKCTTKKICITGEGKDACKQFLGEEGVGIVSLTGNEAPQKARQIEDTLAQAMFNCWNLMGEGKLNLFNGQDGISVADTFSVIAKKPACTICSRVALGEDLTKSDAGKGKEILKQVDMRRALERTIPGRNMTYLEYFTDREFRAYPADFKASFAGSNNADDANVKVTDQIAFVFMQIITDKDPLESAVEKGLTTGVFVGGALSTGVTGKLTSFISLPVKAGITLASVLVSSGISFYQTNENQKTAAIYCGEYTSGEINPKTGKPIAKYGCSVINPVNYYDISAINKLCYRIEGNP